MLLQDAFNRAQEFLDEAIRPEHADEIVIARVTETGDGWEFGYNARRFLEDDDNTASLTGNGPIIVPRSGQDPYVGSLFRGGER
ncbi:MAG: YrhB domain-containing protein [Microthrixaceae bacterium]